MQKVTFQELVERIVERDPRYQPGAYLFVREALAHAQGRFAEGRPEAERHVTGQQLLEGIREFALNEYGPMARELFREWGVHRSEDFGEIVFHLIEQQFLRKTDADRREDFSGGYDFDEAFRDPFLPPSVLARQRRQTPAPSGSA